MLAYTSKSYLERYASRRKPTSVLFAAAASLGRVVVFQVRSCLIWHWLVSLIRSTCHLRARLLDIQFQAGQLSFLSSLINWTSLISSDQYAQNNNVRSV